MVLKLMVIGSTASNAYAETWESFSVPLMASQLRMDGRSEIDLDHAPLVWQQDITVNSHSGDLLARTRLSPTEESPLKKMLFPAHNPAWNRLSPLTVTIKTTEGRYYVIQKQAHPTNSGFSHGITIYVCGGSVRREFNKIEWWSSGIGYSEMETWGTSPALKAFLRDMTEAGFETSDKNSDSSASRRALAEIVSQILNALDVPPDVPERSYEPTPAQTEFDAHKKKLHEGLEEINRQMTMWVRAALTGISEKVENPISASHDNQQVLVDNVLRSHLTPRSLQQVIRTFVHFLPGDKSNPIHNLLNAFFGRPDVQAAIATWNRDPQTRRFLIAEFSNIIDPRCFDPLVIFYGLKLLGLKTSNIMEFLSKKELYFARELGPNWREEQRIGQLENDKVYDVVNQFYYEEVFPQVLDPAIVMAIRQDRGSIERSLRGIDDATILAVRRPPAAPTFVVTHLVGDA